MVAQGIFLRSMEGPYAPSLEPMLTPGSSSVNEHVRMADLCITVVVWMSWGREAAKITMVVRSNVRREICS